MVNTDNLDWASLERLRAGFLSGESLHAPYWKSLSDLESYDATFGERIGWKWDSVLRELGRLNWQPSSRHVLDWGCGSGIAGRRVVEAFGPENFDSLELWDHSLLASSYAADRAQKSFPAIAIHPISTPNHSGQPPGLLVVSHVLNELQPEARKDLLALASRADEILWVEPGTHVASRDLIAVREELLPHFGLVAPCPHQASCPLLEDGNQRHWCHFFASPPPGIQNDSGWVRFGHQAGIDLRSLPFSYLALAKRPASPRPPLEASRLIGRPQHFKGFARLFACGKSGVESLELQKRESPELFKTLKRETEHPLYQWQLDGRRIRAPREACSAPKTPENPS